MGFIIAETGKWPRVLGLETPSPHKPMIPSFEFPPRCKYLASILYYIERTVEPKAVRRINLS